MRRILPLLTVVAMSAWAQQPRGSRCFAACARQVSDPRMRAVACAACVTSPGDPTRWLLHASVTPESLQSDEDWEVRWAGVELESKKKKLTSQKSLSQWVLRETVPLNACLTAAHRAGADRQAMKDRLDPRAFDRCMQPDTGLERALQVELYDPWPPTRRAAMQHMAPAFSKSVGRVVIEAAQLHSSAFDPLLFETLCQVTQESDSSCTSILLAAARPDDAPTMNRLLTVVSARKDEAVAVLNGTKPDAHRQALSMLAELAPVTEAELTSLLDDPDVSIRSGAARALSRGESRSLTEITLARLDGTKPVTPAQQEVLLKIVAGIHPEDCASKLLAAWKEKRVPPAFSKRVFITAASCSWSEVAPDAEALVAKGDPTGIAAMAFAPGSAALFASLEAITTSTDASMRAAAIQALGSHHSSKNLALLRTHLNDASADVRLASIEAVSTFAAVTLEGDLLERLTKDSDPRIRAVAANALPQVATPRSIAALDQAAQSDSDDNVKMVAARSLRKLGGGSFRP